MSHTTLKKKKKSRRVALKTVFSDVEKQTEHDIGSLNKRTAG